MESHAYRYYNRLSALLCLAIYYTRLLYVLYSAWRHYTGLSAVLCLPTICGALLYLVMLQASIQSTDYPL
jgi:hypothetical protein